LGTFVAPDHPPEFQVQPFVCSSGYLKEND
jgi:hypothetical protein